MLHLLVECGQLNRGISDEFRSLIREGGITQVDPSSLTAADEEEYNAIAALADMTLDQIRATSRGELAAWRQAYKEYQQNVRSENDEQRRKFAHDIGNIANGFFNIIDFITGTTDESDDEKLFQSFQAAAKRIKPPKTTP